MSYEPAPGDLLAAPDVPPYPEEWDVNQRVTAYWFAIRMNGIGHITRTETWRQVWNQLKRQQDHRARDVAKLLSGATQ